MGIDVAAVGAVGAVVAEHEIVIGGNDVRAKAFVLIASARELVVRVRMNER